MGNWEGSQIRNDDLAMNTSLTESENGLSDINTTTVKTPPKVNWNCDNTSLTAGKLWSVADSRGTQRGRVVVGGGGGILTCVAVLVRS
jgi:dethiobiotin synthetase